MPHIHLLVWLLNKLRPDTIDRLISAELPNPQVDRELYDLIVKHMIHGPCGIHNPRSPCMKDNKCEKNYPKSFIDETQTHENGYPIYRRRSPNNGGYTATINMRGRREFLIDNKWIVPHCPALLRMFRTHINTECCNGVTAIKYVLKYVYKGSDRTVFNVQPTDDINVCLNYFLICIIHYFLLTLFFF